MRRVRLGLILLILALGGCTTAPGSVRIEPDSVTLARGGVQVLKVTVEQCPHTDVDWDASGGSVSDDGVYTAPDEPGTYSVTAYCRAESRIVDTITVTVTE